MRKLNNENIQNVREQLEKQYGQTVFLDEIYEDGQKAIFTTTDKIINVRIKENGDILFKKENR